MPLHDVKVGVWCATSAFKIIGPFFFLRPFSSYEYVTHVLTHTFFLQDKAKFQITNNSMCSLESVLGDRITRIRLWLPCLTNRTYVAVRIGCIAIMLTLKKLNMQWEWVHDICYVFESWRKPFPAPYLKMAQNI